MSPCAAHVFAFLTCILATVSLSHPALAWTLDTPLSQASASIHGESEGDWLGTRVAGAGDVNGDGYDDFLMGAYKNSEGGERADGEP